MTSIDPILKPKSTRPLRWRILKPEFSIETPRIPDCQECRPKALINRLRSCRFFELPTQADTGNCSVERPCFLSDHTRPPCTEDRGNRLKGILNRAFELDQRGTGWSTFWTWRCDSMPNRWTADGMYSAISTPGEIMYK